VLKSLCILFDEWFFRTLCGLTVFSVKDEHRLKPWCLKESKRWMCVLMIPISSWYCSVRYLIAEMMVKNKIKAWKMEGLWIVPKLYIQLILWVFCFAAL